MKSWKSAFGALALVRTLAIACCVSAVPGWAQTVYGSMTLDPAFAASVEYESLDISFSCSGAPTCIGTYRTLFKAPGCPTLARYDVITLTIDLSKPAGSFDFDIAMKNGGTRFDKYNCVLYRDDDISFTVNATWNGSTGTFVYSQITSDPVTYLYTGTFGSAAQIFPMTGTSNVGIDTSTVSASIKPRAQEAGTTQSVYVFAVAPGTIVAGATGTACTIAQLDATGKLVAASPSNLRADSTGTLAAEGKTVTVLQAVPNDGIRGAMFYVGYGTSSAQMMASALNQRVFSLLGIPQCAPQPPETGWWWNPAEGGRGYAIEARGPNLFFASFLYDVSGRATWYLASGPVSIDGSYFTGDLQSYSGGQTLGGAYPGLPASQKIGNVTLSFSDLTHGTLAWPGGTVPIERFNIVPNGLSTPPLASQPESGWWWNPDESGRGFFMEWQGGNAFIAGFMYDDAGKPLWYVTKNEAPSTDLHSYTGSWSQYGNGQTLTGPYQPPVVVNPNVAPVTIQFSGAETAIMTLPEGRTTSLKRFRF